MSAHIIFITSGEYSDRKTVPLVVCGDEQVADAVKLEVEQEIARLEKRLRELDPDPFKVALYYDNTVRRVLLEDWPAESVGRYFDNTRMHGFSWVIDDDRRGRVEVVIVEVETVGVL